MLRPVLCNRAYYYVFQSVTIIALLLLGGCSIVGPSTIDTGRTPYNEVIQSTAVEQTLLNIVRVQHNEAPLFMDVTEVDAATTLTGSISGGQSAIGAIPNYKSTSAGTISGALGAITGTAQYQEAPTVRYQPLTGQALIAQVGTPLTPSSLSNFLNQGPLVPAVLTLTVARMTHGYLDNYAAMNAIIALDNYGAVTFAATASEGEKKDTARFTVSTAAPAPPDSITIYFEGKHRDSTGGTCDETRRGDNANMLWRRRQVIYHAEGNAITLSTKGSSVVPGKPTRVPVLFPRTAFEVMKAATMAGANILTAPAERVKTLIEKKKELNDRTGCDNGDFYINETPETKKIEREIAEMERKRLFFGTLYPDKAILSEEELRKERVFWTQPGIYAYSAIR